ncbi:unnamed protein product [Caenorhabditis bovis]|uniref:Uncharacterized protein n=1 Tax=Caenorhabditis bovis TaxID=2654633 RepID=A0A8S1FCL4_9PELO|nr:unnamed protein product [Caenorhabditis bovis]
MQIQHSNGFNPNDTKYKSCCCHAKTFTIILGILEIFSICFILVTVLPDLNIRICEIHSSNETTRISTLLSLGAILGYLIYSLATRKLNVVGPYVTGVCLISLFLVFWVYTLYIEIRCAHFIKRSKETGFSISVARPIGPATISLSEREPIPIPIRQLPPLRHTRQQYILNETNASNTNKLDD